MRFIEAIQQSLPPLSKEIDWDAMEALFAGVCLSRMKSTPQNPAYHGEGDVYTHTRMVCRELTAMTAYQALPDRQKTALLLAALLHDLGKVKTTRQENGKWVSPHHASTGSQMVRSFLWRDGELCGSPEAIRFRETVCALVRYHMLPVHLLEQDGAERKIREIAAIGELSPDFSWRLLCMLAEADIRGRIADDIDEGLTQVRLCRMFAEETGCLDRPYPFADAFTKRAYLSGRNIQPDQTLYDDTWGEAVMMSGLPGTGKDTWIHEHMPDLPMVSLDEIRKELHISPTDAQGEVIQAAQERAKEYLRRKQSFVWNATDLTKDTRQKLIGMFERYHARVRIVYLETEWDRRVQRNTARKDAVPEAAIDRMLSKTVPPMPDEAQAVLWQCV